MATQQSSPQHNVAPLRTWQWLPSGEEQDPTLGQAAASGVKDGK